MALIVAAVVAVLAGRTRARATILGTQAAAFDRLAAADLEIRCSPGHFETLREAAAVADVAESEVRLLAAGVLRVEGRRPLPCIVRVLPEDAAPRMQRLELVEGRMPRRGEAAAVIDRALGPLLDLGIGDTVEVTVAHESRQVPVVGVALSCEYPIAPIHPHYVLPLRGTVGAIALSHEAAREHKHAHRATSILLRLRPGQSADLVCDAVADSGVSIIRCTPAARQPGRLYLTRLIANFDVFSPVVVGGLGVAGAFLAFLLMGRLVRRERVRVGVLAIQGFDRAPLVLSFLGLAVPTALAGAALGFVAHAWVAHALVHGTTANLGFLPVQDSGADFHTLWSGAACLVVLTLAVLLPAAILTRLSPARALAPGRFEVARAPGGFLLHAVARLRRAARVPSWMAMGVTHALRRRRETLGAAVGLGIAFAVLFGFLSVHLAHRREIPAAVRNWSRDATVHMDAPVNAAAVGELGDAVGGRSEPFLARSVFLLRDGRPVARRLLGLTPDGIAAGLPLAAGRCFSSGDALETVVDRYMALRDGISVGDELHLLPFFSAPEATVVSVVGIVDGISFGRVLLPLGTARAMYGLEGMSSGAYIAADLPGEELERRLWGVAHVESVFGTRRIVADITDALSARLHVIRLGIFTVIGYALIFLAIVASLDAEDRAPQVALLTSMGWRGRALFGMLASEVVARGLLGLLLGLAATPFLADWFARRIEEANGYHIATPVPWLIVGVVSALALMTFVLAAIPAWRASSRQPVSQMVSLLSRE